MVVSRRTLKAALAAFLFGAIYSWVVVAYYVAIDEHDALRAAFVDLELGFLAVGSLQAWETSGRQFVVLAAEVVGMALGSYGAVRQLTP